MYTEIPVLSKCCCCFPLRDGILVWAYLRLVAATLTAGEGFLLAFAYLAFANPDTVTTVIILSTLGLVAVDVIFNFILIIGCHKKSVSLLRIYCRCGVLYVIFAITLFITWFVNSVVPIWRYYDGVKYYNLESWTYIGCTAAFVAVILFLHIYLMILVRSEIIKLNSNCQFRFINHTADSECYLQSPGYEVT